MGKASPHAADLSPGSALHGDDRSADEGAGRSSAFSDVWDPYGVTQETLVQEARERAPKGLETRERIGETFAALAFLTAATLMVALLPAGRPLQLGTAAILVVGYAIASRIKFEIGTGFTVPTQLVLVPMLFLLPTPMVPLFVAAGNLLGDLPDYLRGRRHPERMIMAFGDSWHAVGPALVLSLFASTDTTLSDWPIFVAALGAQFVFDLASTTAREWFELGVSPRVQLADAVWIWLVDALLSPIALVAVTAAPVDRFLLLPPLIVLLARFAYERRVGLERALQLSDAYRGTTTLLADVIEHDDNYTGSHSRGVVSLSLEVGEKMGLDAAQLRNVEFAALLHDVGKLAISKDIINKKGPLSKEEWALMKVHTITGEEMLGKVGGLFADVAKIVRSSHERWDGDGYPDGLKGVAIPLEARIVSCCDAFDAMTTDRSYRPAMTVDAALDEVRHNAGTQFDPGVALTLIEVVMSEKAENPAARELAELSLAITPAS